MYIGTLVISRTRDNLGLPYFQLDVGRSLSGAEPPAAKDGTYTSGGFYLWSGGSGFTAAARIRITLTGGRTSGTFSAVDRSGRRATGSFAC